jgi:hypothetical protein
MKKYLMLLFLVPVLLRGQDSINSNFRLSVNPSVFQNKEPVMNGQANTCVGFTAQAGWERINLKKTHYVGLTIGMARPKSDFEPVHFSLLAGIELRYQYLKMVYEKNSSRLHLGGLASIHYRLGYYPLWDDSHPYWATNISAGIALRYEKKFRERGIYFLSYEMPLIGLLSRPPLLRQYKIDDPEFGNLAGLMHQDMEVATVNRYIDLGLKTGFYLPYSGRFASEFYIFFNYLSLNTSYSKPYREIQTGLGITFIL